MIRLIALLLALGLSPAIAQPTPVLGDSVQSYLARYETWLGTISEEDQSWDGLERLFAEVETLIAKSALTDDPEDEHWEESAAFVRDHPELVKQIAELSDRPHIGLPIEVLWTEDVIDVDAPPSMQISLPHLGMLVRSTRILAVDAIIAESIGDRTRVLRDLRAIQQLAPRAIHANSMIEHLVAIALNSKLTELTLSDQLRLEEWDAKELALLSEILDGIEVFKDAEKLTSFEHWGMHQLLDWLYQDSQDGRLTEAGATKFVIMIKRFDGMLEPVDQDPDEVSWWLMQLLISNQVLPVGTLRDASDKFITAVRVDMNTEPWEMRSFRSDELIDSWMSRGDLDLRYAPISVSAPSFFKFYNRAVSAQAVDSAARLLVELHRHRSEHGSFPAALLDLDPELLGSGYIDPFSGSSLRYQFVDGHPMIYSVGPDRNDDDGDEMLDEFGDPKAWPQFIPLDDLESMHAAERKAIDGDWILYPPAE